MRIRRFIDKLTNWDLIFQVIVLIVIILIGVVLALLS